MNSDARRFKDLTLHDFWDGDKPLNEQQAAMFYMACYDLDRFRRFVFETRFLQLFEVDEARIEALRSDDQELLEFGMQWLRFAIFQEKSMKPRKNAAPAEERRVTPGASKPVLVIGGGIAGITTAVEAADAG